MTNTSIEEKVAFLSRSTAYSDATSRVETKETHWSWIFLTNTHAWKLKKPVCRDYLDFSTPEARRINCEDEVRLNRRLAPNVYLGVVPLTTDSCGSLKLGGKGQPIDWLVQMRRLPSNRMLDRAIADGTWTDADIREVGKQLAAFYRNSPQIRMSGAEYRLHLSQDLRDVENELKPYEADLVDLSRFVIATELNCLDRHAGLFDKRVLSGKIIEAHGDLRAEHICLERQPVMIDCLEFKRSLRILDPASELTFLALECERLGTLRIGELILTTYREETGDSPPDPVLRFYKAYHACLRAMVAVWHLRDRDMDRAKWIARAKEYLRLAFSIPATV